MFVVSGKGFADVLPRLVFDLDMRLYAVPAPSQ